MSFHNNQAVHYTGRSDKYGRNFLVRYDIPTGGKRNTWRLVSFKGEELRLPRARWEHDLKPGWFYHDGRPHSDEEIAMQRAIILDTLNEKRTKYTTARADTTTVTATNDAYNEAVRQLNMYIVENRALKAEIETLKGRLAKYEAVHVTPVEVSEFAMF